MGLDVVIQTLWDGKLPASKATLYTVPAGKAVIIRSLTLVNTSGADKTVNLYVKPSGSTSRSIVPKNYTFLAGDQADVVDGDPICLAAGDVIEGECVGDATGVDGLITGVTNEPV